MMRAARVIRTAFVLSICCLGAVTVEGCDWGGCAQPNGSGCGDFPVSGPDMARAATTACATGCPGGCPSGEQCITPAAITQDRAFCAPGCTDNRDCAAGSRCVVLFAAMQPASCISDSFAVGFTDQSGAICDTQAACDGDVAKVRFSDNARGICGWELVHCANGCTAGACNP
jgi:hypothetical protein